MSAPLPFYSHLAVAAAALEFAHSYTLTALEGGPSQLLLEAAIGDAKIALRYLMHAADALEDTRQETGALPQRLRGQLPISPKSAKSLPHLNP